MDHCCICRNLKKKKNKLISNAPPERLVVKTVLLLCFSVRYFIDECNTGMLTRDNTLFTHSYGSRVRYEKVIHMGASDNGKQLWAVFPKI